MKKQFFAKHNKSSALVVSLVIHGLILVGALSFVAVTVIQKNEVDFAAKPVKRPRMNLRKLQVPVKKPVQQPKLRKQIVVKPNIARITTDIKMPEIVGVKGGLGAGAGGFGGGASLGFTMPELNLFGIKGKGEKVFIILDSSAEMMYDTIGGIPAYTIIKQELVKTLGTLSPAALFNVAVYDERRTELLFPELVRASASNVTKVEQWLKPLNAVESGMGSKDWGIGTLGKGSERFKEEFNAGKVQRERFWYTPAAVAMQQQADTVFLLTCQWGQLYGILETRDNSEWYKSSAGKRWLEAYEENKKKLEEENRSRASQGRPPMVVEDDPREINRIFSPDIERPPLTQVKHHYTPRELTEALLEIRNTYRPADTQAKLGIQRKRSASEIDFSLNVIHFQPTDAGGQKDEKFIQMVRQCDGEYHTLEGLKAIERSVQ